MVERRIAELYGDVDLAAATGVVHVVSVVESDGVFSVIKIGPQAPKSPTDFFALNLARARADTILVTGQILRMEPTLRYDLPDDLRAWRQQPEPPTLLILTSGRGLDLDHPAFRSWARPAIFTSHETAAALSGANVRVIGHADPSPRSAVDWALANGADLISVEAGPSTASALYAEPTLVDEVLLSEFDGELPDAQCGGSPFTRADLEAALRPDRPPHAVAEDSGPWRFTRWTRDQRT